MEKEDKRMGIWLLKNMSILISSFCLGCVIMFICNKEAIRHYNSCQESELLKKLSESRDEKQWYVKEDAVGKIKLIQLSINQIDSLNK